MSDSLSGAGGSLLFRTVAVTIVVMGFFGVATGALPVRCLIGGVCGASPQPAAVPTTQAPARDMPAAASVEPVAMKTAPTLTSNDVIAATFAQLKIDLKPPSAPETSPVQVAVANPPPASVVTNPDTGLSKRVVRAITVHPDGTPDLSGTLAQAYAAPTPLLSTPSPAVEAAARIGAGQTPVVETRVADLSPADAAPVKLSGLVTVAGKGANVRSSPGKSSKVLFALRGGEQVTIVENKRGWMRIKDDQGRVGWIYSDGLIRS